MKYYSVSFDIASMNISGEILITRTVPSRSAITLSTDLDANMINIGALGWDLPVPAGDVTAYVKVGKKTISFDSGSGYHDHNWGNGLAGFENWYAIHARLGPYTFTAIEALLSSSSSFGQAYLTYNSQTLIASFNASSVTVRPWGNGAQYPPMGYYPNPLGVTIGIDAGEKGKFHFNLTSKTASSRVALGKRLGKWFRSVMRGRVGGKTYTGPGMFEWLDLVI
ncbi:hypothetical protein AOQ84DRAFT_358080 [Glonium stellatum]|uniref:AsqO/PenF-like C-terminal domain-containing protein n=1 Tax=Glonium stellatum TaxID=574774 RepID=A0A8E2FEB4_9PEZI|nr:hypothetical protein AOQ84DRAFT_358080 [Glonium stellatum]